MQKYIVAALMAALASHAAAEPYGGAALGVSRFKVDCSGLDRCDKSDTAFKFFGGYRYNAMLAGEVGYIDFGKSKSNRTQDGFQLEGVLKSQALVASAVLTVPLAAGIDGVAKAGVASVQASLDQRADGQVISSTDRQSWQPYLGLGLQYKLRPAVALGVGVDLTRLKLDSPGSSHTSNVSLFSAGVTYGF